MMHFHEHEVLLWHVREVLPWHVRQICDAVKLQTGLASDLPAQLQLLPIPDSRPAVTLVTIRTLLNR